MASTWDIISSILFLGVFLGVVFLAVKFSSVLSTSTTSAQSSLKSQGITYQQGRLSVQTDRAAPSRDEYIASTQAAFNRGAKTLKSHADAFSFKKGQNQEDSSNGQASGIDTSIWGYVKEGARV
ncbi:uncharacterized protein I206_105434 [Kwoniella pini CBS 10737]|uniref:Uncharacterized protein n=1 Tax=Kwoniella pini CBS 10737 TaxID=1296096 RepID=A0A1B9I490_9TREE|nr:uncharacterized protein I206_03660 [Kwoniella pini CBS 10737]OCF50341.1 hypothetical protein I206_03660 [Kwoniella pini CBS 10737]